MPSLTDTTNEQLGEAARNRSLVQDDADHAVCPPAAGALGHDLDRNDRSPASVRNTSTPQGGVKPSEATPVGPDVASAATPPDHGESDEELGAFDDSHLQVDQPKKKKKKKSKSKKSKSKRGLVICFLLRPSSADLGSYRTLLLDSKSTVQMLQSRPQSTMKTRNSMTCKQRISPLRTGS